MSPSHPPTACRPLFGVSGWDYRDWRGVLYPDPRPRGFRGLEYLSRYLDFMEVNATFYHPMGGERSHRWLAETPDSFTFVLKAFGGWTHRGEAPRGENLALFRELLVPLAEAGRLEGVLAQYSPAWRAPLPPAARQRLVALKEALQPAELFVEVRHASLYHADFFRFLEDRGIAFVNVDLPRHARLPRPSTVNTCPRGYLRLHGRSRAGWANPRAKRDERYDYHYPPDERSELMAAVRVLATRVPRLLVAANNHFRAQAPAAALALKSLWAGAPVPMPSRLVSAYPDLRPFARPEPDDESPA